MLNSEKIAFIFPGQGSQSVGMGRDLAENFKICRDIIDQGNNILGFDLSKIMWEGPAEDLNDTINTQPALFVHSIAALTLINSEFPELKPVLTAGHSLGEISSLVCAGAISFENGMKLVRMRGELMKEAGKISPGGMAAVLGLNVETLDGICSQVSTEGSIVQVANDNCPGQIVISGHQTALDKAMELAKKEGARKIRLLAVSIAAHSRLMDSARCGFNDAIEKIDSFKNAQIPIVSNVTALPMIDVQELKADILAQLNSRVRWTESIKYIRSAGVNYFVEIGNGNILTGLLKRIDENSTGITFGEFANVSSLRSEMDVSTSM